MSIYKRGNKGVYYMNIMVNGIRLNISTGKHTKKEAKQVAALERQRLLEQAKITQEERATSTLLSDAIDKVYTTRWKHNKDAAGSHNRANRLVELMGNIPLGSITKSTIDKLIKKMESSKITPATQNRYLTALKTLLKEHDQPTSHIKLKRENNSRTRVITKEEEILFITTLTEVHKPNYDELADLIQLLADTGLRLSEALEMTYKENINFTTNLIVSYKNKSDRPKSVPMTNRVKEILTRRQIDNPTRPFTITKYQADFMWTRMKKQLGLEAEKELVLHSWRHAFASRLVSAGVDLYVVKELLSHSTIKLTERYSHLDPGKLVHAVEVLDGITG